MGLGGRGVGDVEVVVEGVELLLLRLLLTDLTLLIRWRWRGVP